MVATMMKMATGNAGHGALFLFGDSLLDVGTNNHFNDSSARADHQYYGIDYPHSKATGRFSNGYNSADLIAWFLTNFALSPPPFLSLADHSAHTFLQEIFKGANFASAGSGILIDTGHDKYAKVLGSHTADIFLAMSTYIISVGSNDFFEHQGAIYSNLTKPEYLIANLTTTYSMQLQKIRNNRNSATWLLSDRTIPQSNIILRRRWLCGGMNDLAQAFHASTEALLQNFSATNQGVFYSLGNTYNTIMDFIDNPRANGFEVVDTACCGNGTFNAEKKCERGAKLCTNRDEYLFWDEFHPTQAASRRAALTLVFAEGPEFVTPMNFSSLAKVSAYV
ncbi:hypothetical protein OSB04_000570 [Centaurea solstitialis]|uniref:GDSL esterase/lipase n=1 Tax=Centaurea solstitialis TaxID=347529 RepID=A0AA38WTX6_9ASTR|nr:hypothetical protein OSB04_000570 [Centaurea solstitialis]